jgi:hypothetical protein
MFNRSYKICLTVSLSVLTISAIILMLKRRSFRTISHFVWRTHTNPYLLWKTSQRIIKFLLQRRAFTKSRDLQFRTLFNDVHSVTVVIQWNEISRLIRRWNIVSMSFWSSEERHDKPYYAWPVNLTYIWTGYFLNASPKRYCYTYMFVECLGANNNDIH